MKQRILWRVAVLLLLALVTGSSWYLANNPQLRQQLLVESGLAPPEAEKGGITASGFIEVRQVALAPEVSGHVDHLTVDEGDQVVEGQVLVEIDTQLLDAQIAEAEAAVEMARAQLARVQAGARAEEVALAEAAVVMAKAQREAAFQAWQDAILLRDNPQELDLQIADVQSQIATWDHHIQQMAAFKDAAELMDALRERQVKIVEEGIDWSTTVPGVGHLSGHYDFPEGDKRRTWAGWNLATTDLWSAWVNLNQAVAARDAAQQNLRDLLALRHNPQQAQVQVARAEADYRQSAAGVLVAQANLDLIRTGPTQEQIEVARTGLEQAQAALDTLQVQRKKYTLHAPITGMITERLIRQGEKALPGTSLLMLGNLDSVDLTIYVPEPEVGQVFLGQYVEVTVDSFPGEKFPGQVVWVSDEAEFTPKNVQTKEERVSTVFAVKVNIPNSDHRLSPGMPADAVLVPE